MKSLLALLVVLTVGMEAQAVQTSDCGDSMAELKDVISRKFRDVMEPNYVDRFIGTWKNGDIIFKVSGSQRFKLNKDGKTYTYRICPQGDKSFFVQVTALFGGGNTGIIKYSNGRVKFSYGTDQLAQVNGTYVKVDGRGDQ